MASYNDVDTGAVFKYRVPCLRCNEDFYFPMRAIAAGKTLKCPQCGSEINLAEGAYETLVTTIQNTLAVIDDGSVAVTRQVKPQSV